MGPRGRQMVAVAAIGAATALVAGAALVPLPPAPASVTERFGTAALARQFADAVPDADTPESSSDRASLTSSGVLSADAAITVANLTVRPGQFVVGYTFEARLQSSATDSALHCGVVDANGGRAFLLEDTADVTAGDGWQRRTLTGSLALSDTTLGLRCVPDGSGVAVAAFRDIHLAVVRVPRD